MPIKARSTEKLEVRGPKAMYFDKNPKIACYLKKQPKTTE